jgi:hypothetical protein
MPIIGHSGAKQPMATEYQILVKRRKREQDFFGLSWGNSASYWSDRFELLGGFPSASQDSTHVELRRRLFMLAGSSHVSGW